MTDQSRPDYTGTYVPIIHKNKNYACERRSPTDYIQKKEQKKGGQSLPIQNVSRETFFAEIKLYLEA